MRTQTSYVPGFELTAATGISGSDFECAGSILPGQCAFTSVLDAATICAWITQCLMVVVYSNGRPGAQRRTEAAMPHWGTDAAVPLSPCFAPTMQCAPHPHCRHQWLLLHAIGSAEDKRPELRRGLHFTVCILT